jgi:predicted O-methyltransferase YrrM
MEQYRHTLLQNTELINISDLGAGSRVSTKGEKTVRDIARHSSSTAFRSRLLFRMAGYLNAMNILELGTNLGLGTQALALSSSEAEITTIEGCPELHAFAKEQLQAQGLRNVRFLQGTFADILPGLTEKQWDLVFIDGHHDKDATLKYANMLLDRVHEQSLVILDDINWSPGMQSAWQALKEHPKVTVTVDTFFWGLLFFRKGQAPEHFKIRL